MVRGRSINAHPALLKSADPAGGLPLPGGHWRGRELCRKVTVVSCKGQPKPRRVDSGHGGGAICCLLALSRSIYHTSLIRLGSQGTNRQTCTPQRTGPEGIRRKVITSQESLGKGTGRQGVCLTIALATSVHCHPGPSSRAGVPLFPHPPTSPTQPFPSFLFFPLGPGQNRCIPCGIPSQVEFP